MKEQIEAVYRKRIGKKIKHLRIINHYTQEEIAKVLKVSNKTISRIENGKNSLSVETFILLVNLFDEDAGMVLDDISDFYGIETFINELFYKLERNPIENFESISIEIEKYLTNMERREQLSKNEREKLDLIQQVALLSDKKAHNFVKKTLSKHQYSLVLTKLRYINCSTFFMDTNTLFALMDEIITNHRKFTRNEKTKHMYTHILMNAVGNVIDKLEMTHKLKDYLPILKKIIKKNNLYYFLPMFYYRQAQYYYIEGNNQRYEEFKLLSLTTAEVFDNKSLIVELVKKYQQFENLFDVS